MNSDFLISLCLIALMALGGFVLVFSLIRLTTRSAQSQIRLPFMKLELRGPAWLVSAFLGALMISAPILAAALQKPENVTSPPAAVEDVARVPEPNYSSFRFSRDVSLLDLRAADTAPWYAAFPGLSKISAKSRIRPAVLHNYMLIRKIEPASEIHLVYGTSGRLDVLCLTHPARYQRSRGNGNGETWDVVADISTVKVGDDFELAVEATYWDAFSGPGGDNYTTYAHGQAEPEELSVILLFADNKPFRGEIAVTQYPPNPKSGGQHFDGQARSWPGPQNKAYYWTTTSRRPGWFYKLAWYW